jgi:signal transduction histidine kinase/CheY-like chemotaxis protein
MSQMIMPTLPVGLGLLASADQLAGEANPHDVIFALSSSMARWKSEHPALEEPLKDTLTVISSLLPPSPSSPEEEEESAPVSSATRDDVARVLRYASLQLAPFAREEAEQETLRAVNARLKSILRESLPPSLAHHVLIRHRPSGVSSELMLFQMIDTLRHSIAKISHDANNMLAVLTCSLDEADEERQNYRSLVLDNLFRAPSDEVKRKAMLAQERFQTSLEGLHDLVATVVSLIRRIQSVANPASKFSKELSDQESVAVVRLFTEGGLIARTGRTLTDLRAGLEEAEEGVRAFNALARDHGHVAPLPIREESKRLRENIAVCVATIRDLTELMIALFDLLVAIAEQRRHQESARPMLFHDQLNDRLIAAIMGKGVGLTLNRDPDPWKIPGPAIEIWQVGLNLMFNARDAMDHVGNLTITTERTILSEEDLRAIDASLIRPAARPGEYMALHIEDTGPGIPSQVLPRIFDLAYSDKGSTGLGLSMVLEIVERMGGFITVKSPVRDSGGASFSIYFPRAEDDSRPQVFDRPLPVKGQEVVLVVDDDSQVLASTKKMLLRLGHHVLTASSGPEAVATLSAWYEDPGRPAVSVVLMDLILPGPAMKGLIEALRSEEPGIACLFMSGYGDLPEGYRGVKRSSFLNKPMKLADFRGHMRLLIDGIEGRDPA